MEWKSLGRKIGFFVLFFFFRVIAMEIKRHEKMMIINLMKWKMHYIMLLEEIFLMNGKRKRNLYVNSIFHNDNLVEFSSQQMDANGKFY